MTDKLNVYNYTAINNHLNVALQKIPDPKEDDMIAPLVSELKHETQRLIGQLPLLLKTKDKHIKRERFCQRHNSALLDYMDVLIDQLPVNERQQLKRLNHVPRETDWFKMMYNCLEDLLISLQQEFAPYLPTGDMIPDSYLEGAAKEIRKNLKLLKAKLEEAEIDPQIWSILSQHLNQLLPAKGGGYKVTYNSLNYIKQLYFELLRLIPLDNKDVFQELQEVLVYMNFNDRNYFYRIRQLLQKELDNILLLNDKLSWLFDMQLIVRREPVRNGAFVENDQDKLQQQIDGFLQVTIANLDLKIKQYGTDHIAADLMRWISFKLRLGGSSHLLGYSLELLCQSNFFLNENKKELAEFFTFFSDPMKGGKLSASSLRRKFSTPRESSVRILIEVLGQMQKIARGHLNAMVA